MLIDLTRVFQESGKSLKVTEEISLNDFELYGNYPFKKPVSVDAVASNNAGIVTLDITVDFEYSAPCDRCLAEVVTPMHYEFSHNLAAALNNEDNDDYIETPDFKLELDELVVSDIILQLPSKNLCSEDCKGICPECGQNLNVAQCGCSSKHIDPRLEKLRQLID